MGHIYIYILVGAIDNYGKIKVLMTETIIKMALSSGPQLILIIMMIQPCYLYEFNYKSLLLCLNPFV